MFKKNYKIDDLYAVFVGKLDNKRTNLKNGNYQFQNDSFHIIIAIPVIIMNKNKKEREIAFLNIQNKEKYTFPNQDAYYTKTVFVKSISPLKVELQRMNLLLMDCMSKESLLLVTELLNKYYKDNNEITEEFLLKLIQFLLKKVATIKDEARKDYFRKEINYAYQEYHELYVTENYTDLNDLRYTFLQRLLSLKNLLTDQIKDEELYKEFPILARTYKKNMITFFEKNTAPDEFE